MFQKKDFIIAVTVIVVSQWAGQIWLANRVPSGTNSSDGSRLENAVAEMGYQLERIESLQSARIATVNPAANTVTMDQSMLQDTLRDIVADELAKVSPSISAEYANTTYGTGYVGETSHMQPEQAYAQSETIMQEAIQYGEWDGDHTAAMAPLINNLTQEHRIQLLEQYTEALNRGEIKMTGIAPPL